MKKRKFQNSLLQNRSSRNAMCFMNCALLLQIALVAQTMADQNAIRVSDLQSSKVIVAGRFGLPVGTLFRAKVTHVSDAHIEVLHKESTISLDMDNLVVYRYVDERYSRVAIDAHTLVNKQIDCFEIFESLNYPAKDFFQEGDYLPKFESKTAQCNLVLVLPDVGIQQSATDSSSQKDQVSFEKIEKGNLKIFGSFGQTIESVVVGSLEFKQGKIWATAEGLSRELIFADIEFVRPDALSVVTDPISDDRLRRLVKLEGLKMFERVTMIGIPKELFTTRPVSTPQISTRTKNEPFEVVPEDIHFKIELVVRLGF
jgi:hypothetical protein